MRHMLRETPGDATAYRDAQEALEAISNPGDRDIVQQTFDHIPSP